ncbi:hypothetical protein [Bizionia sp. M204]|uniref:hypothetical protein n=1 Tax=Bizionia sp. M204 TaxID=2675331 RepID=UPI00206AAA88|nr:hypothetical protein [Bizionia sp. M204]UPS92001.1 hypothetical protein GMA17_09830 [Bizionia sp. M204]
MRHLIFSLLVFISFSNASAQKIENNNFSYEEDVTFTIKRFNNSKTTQYGNGTDNRVYIAQGARFKTAWIEISNNTKEDKEINFETFYLIDSQGKKYHVHIVVQSGKMGTTVERYKQQLKAGKERLFFAEFWPPYPKNEKIESMEVNGKIIKLKEVE